MERREKEFLAKAADAFNLLKGRPTLERCWKPLCPEFARRVADAYHLMKHDPSSPEVQASYHSFKQDLREQWNFVTQKVGIVCQPWNAQGQPYASSQELIEDIENNHHLFFFEGGDMPMDHPLNEIHFETGHSYNCLLRVIHDIFGHAAYRLQLGPIGEEHAYQLHCQMFRLESIPALTTETRGQSCWVNFGSHLRNAEGKIPLKGEKGYIAPQNRPYADQKAGLLPQEFILRVI